MNELKIYGIYKHFKGDKYIVEGEAIDSMTGEKVVIYRGLYGDGTHLFVRPKESFLEEVDHVKYPDYNQKYRFELQEIARERKDIQ